MSRLALLVISSTSLISQRVAADVTRCAGGDADLSYHASAFDELRGDTGWIPGGSPAQVRVTGRVAGETTIAMGMHPTACWPGAMELGVPGRAGAGLLDFAYGAELHLFAQIHTTILGNPIDWVGEIPVPLIPTDLMLASTSAFDPGAAATAAASDTTSPITVLGTNLIGDYIGIIGISGGLHLDVTGAMTASYRTTTLATVGGAVVSAGARVAIAAPGSGFGDALDLPLSATGQLTYAPSLIFTIAFDVKILGIRVVDWKLFSVAMALPALDRDVTLASDGAHLPLPHANVLAGARVDFASGSTQRLTVRNTGEAALMIEATAPPAGVAVAPLTVAPGADGVLEVSAAADALATGTGRLVLTTNDPGQATVDVVLGRGIGGTASGAADDGSIHAGCDAGAGSAGLMIGLVALRLRRRRAG